jgi:hypothetical protein
MHVFDEATTIRVDTLNVGGLQWDRMDNKLKLRSLILLMRERRTLVAMLSELHHAEMETPTVAYIEEFTLVQWKKVGILLAPAARVAWEDASVSLGTSSLAMIYRGERNLALPLRTLTGDTYMWFQAVYIPSSGPEAEREAVYRELLETKTRCEELKPARVLVGGDFNGHVGNDAIRNFGGLGHTI